MVDCGCCQAKFSTLGCPSCFFLKAMKISVQRFIVTFDSLLVNLFYFRQIWLEVDLEEPDIIKTMVHNHTSVKYVKTLKDFTQRYEDNLIILLI